MALKTNEYFRLVDLSTTQIKPEYIQKKRVKIVCTIGPASDTQGTLEKLLKNGMNVARLNFSHGTHQDHLRRMTALRSAAKKKNVHLGLLQDIQGPKIRIGRFEEGEIHLKPNDKFILTTELIRGNSKRVSCSYKKLHGDVKKGHRILIDDGLVFLVVEDIQGRDIHTRVVFGGKLSDNKGMNLPDTRVKISCLTPKDKKDLAFGLKQEVDFMALSFVNSAEDIQTARRLTSKSPHPPLLVAKIETSHAVSNAKEIIAVSDGIMVARGDLGVECALEQVPALQKQLIQEAIRQGKFVITATQMLETMTSNPRPTRAEASDVANAVLDGTDAVMLSAETASGKFPVEAVKTMSRIIVRTEDYVHETLHAKAERMDETNTSISTSLVAAAVQAAESVEAHSIIAFSQSGTTPAKVSRHRPQQTILALTPFDRICRRLSVFWGVIPHVTSPMKHTDEMKKLSKAALKKLSLYKKNQTIVMVSGTPVRKPGTANMLKILKVD